MLLRLKIHPEHLGAKPGDRIGVQLIHCPNGWQFVADMAMMSMAHAMMDTPQPHRMTNRVDFVLPPSD